MTRYLDINSTYRNREVYPGVSQFEVSLGVPKNSGEQAIDPVLNGCVYHTWQGGQSAGPIGPGGPLSTGTFTSDSLAYESYVQQDDCLPVIADQAPPVGPAYGAGGNDPLTLMANDVDYYTGYRLVADDGAGNVVDRIITEYDPLKSMFITDTAFHDGDNTDGNTYYITDPSTSQTIHIPTYDYFGTKLTIRSHYYQNWYIYDETDNDFRKISDYDYLTNAARLETPFGGTWAASHIFTLRKTKPEARFTVASITGNTITLDADASSEDSYYVGKFIYVTGLMGIYTLPVEICSVTTARNKAYYISNYDGATRTCTIYKRNQPLPLIDILAVPGQNSVVNIVSFLQDNYVPLQYSGNNSAETVEHELSLVNLSLPNSFLATGGHIGHYPYLYVQLSSTMGSSSSSSGTIIYGNNPNSRSAMFLVPMNNVYDLESESFTVLCNTDMIPVIRFKPNDSFKFGVFLPNGQPVQPLTPELYSPFGVNPEIQISALFSMRPLK